MVELGLSWCTSIVRASRRLTYRSGVPDSRAVLINGHTEHVPRAPDFFEGPQLGVVKYFFKLIILLLMLLHDRTNTSSAYLVNLQITVHDKCC